MSKKKLLRYAQFSALPNSYECPDYHQPELRDHKREVVELRGRWAAAHFGNEQPLTLELGCGRGEYTVALAERYPERNFIGIDIKGNRMHVGASTAIERGLHNAAFVRMPIECIQHFFAPGEVSEIWITFADPQPVKPRKRLTSRPFLARYRPFLAPEHRIHLKTDSDILYESTLEVIAEEGAELLYQNNDIYAAALAFSELECKTHYEKIHLALGKTIKYLCFRLPGI